MQDSQWRNSALNAAVFSHSHLERADFSGAKLQHAILQRAQLSGASFSGALLADAHFQDANCQGVDFTGCVGLDSAHFGDSDLRGCRMPWDKLGSKPSWFRGARVTQAEYDAIPLETKQDLKLRIVSQVETEDVRLVRERLKDADFVVYVLGYGAVAQMGEVYCREVVRLVTGLSPAFSSQVVDIIGQTQLIETLLVMCEYRRSWPKVFFKGKFIGGYNETVSFIENKKYLE